MEWVIELGECDSVKDKMKILRNFVMVDIFGGGANGEQCKRKYSKMETG